MLGHSSITITADTYTSVLPELARAAAEGVAGLLPRISVRLLRECRERCDRSWGC
jgi:hypothetical protein